MKFTERQIRNIKPKEDRYEIWEGNGLGIRIAPSGRKSWIYMYRFNGKPRRMTLGTYPEMTVASAHASHGQAMLDLANNIDPGEKLVSQHQEHRNAATLNELALEYIDKWAKKHKRSWKEDERMLNKDVLPKLGTLKAKDISRRDIIKLLDEISERAPIVANRTFEVIRKMFNFAVERGIIDVSPCLNIRAPSKEKQRERMLTEDEITTFWHNLTNAKMNEATRIALKLQLITAQRRGEVAQMEWSEVDVKTGWWTIPAIKAKNNSTHRVPLSDMAIRYINEAKRLSGESRFVFPSPLGDKCMAPGAVTRAIGKNRAQFEIEPFTPHDLRRTAASHMTRTGISRLVVSKILNHMDSGVTAIYDRHSYDIEKREAIDKWSQQLTLIINEPLKSGTQSSLDGKLYQWCNSDDANIRTVIINIRIMHQPFDTLDDDNIIKLIAKLTEFLDSYRNHRLVRTYFSGSEAPDDIALLLALDEKIALDKKSLNISGLKSSNLRPFKKYNASLYHLLEILALKLSASGDYVLAMKAATHAERVKENRLAKSIGGSKGRQDNTDRDEKIREKARTLFNEGARGKQLVLSIAEIGDNPGEKQIQNILNKNNIPWQ